MSNPYESPTEAIAEPVMPAVRWQRTMVWAVLIQGCAMVVGISSALSMDHWEFYGRSFEEAAANARLVRRILYGVAGAILYWRFAAGIASHRLLHVVALYLVVQVIDVGVTLAISHSVDTWFDPWSFGRSLIAASVGYACAVIGSGRPSRRQLVRDVA
jgi:hypothetical protein